MVCALLILELTSFRFALQQSPARLSVPISNIRSGSAQEGFSVGDLIRVLDKVRPVAYVSPETWFYESDPVYKALYEKGPEAVEPLIKAFASDERPIDNTVVGVKQDRFKPVKAKEIAYRILLDILDCGDVYDLNHQPTPKELLTFWRANRNLAPAERHYNVLKNDAASVDDWAQAAQRLTDPADSKRRIESYTRGSARAGILGEPLRAYINPSMTELMAKRLRKAADLAAPTTPVSAAGRPELPVLDALVRSLAKWDPSGSVETFRTLCRFQMQEHPDGFFLAHMTLLLVDARIKAGDASAVSDYLAWIKPMTNLPGWNFDLLNYLFQPFVAHSNEPEVRKAVKEIINTPNSIWSPKGLGKADWFVGSPLLVFPEFYDVVTAALDDKEPSPDPYRTIPDRRVCDSVALQLTSLHGAPQFDPKASEANRDKMISTMKDFLKTNRTHPGDLVDWPSSWQDIL